MGAAQLAPGNWISHEPRRPVVAPGEEAGEAGCVLTRVTDMQTMGPTQQMAFVAAIGRVMKRGGITDEMASSPWSFEFPPPEQVNQRAKAPSLAATATATAAAAAVAATAAAAAAATAAAAAAAAATTHRHRRLSCSCAAEQCGCTCSAHAAAGSS